MMTIDEKYKIGDTVYLITDREQIARLVVSIVVNKYDLLYRLACGASTSDHYDYEISTEKDLVNAI